MQTVQFQCGHCGKLMAVGSEYLGQQVRCPHCQQIVIAPPASAPAPPPQPPPHQVETVLHTPAQPGEGEDIFSQTEVSDDLFGRTEGPRVEMPPEVMAPTLPGDNPAPAPQPEATVPSTMPYVPPSTLGDGTAILPGGEVTAPWMAPTEMMTTQAVEAPPSFPSEPSAAREVARPPRRSESRVPWFLLLVFSPLLLYAIIITVFSALLYRQEQEVEERLRQRFEYMPDEGDKPGVQKGKKTSWRFDYKSSLPTEPLPENLCTTLGKPLQIGDIQVKPIRVERKRVRVVVEGFNPERCKGDSLVLYLKLKNMSKEYAFAPLDNYFDRCYHSGSLPPLTLLEAGSKQRFYGGPAEWFPAGDGKNKRQWVEGRDDMPTVLEPDEEKEMFVCTNGDDDKAVSVLFGNQAHPAYHGSFLWRVRVRRGLYLFKDKERSYTAVVGVHFTDKDIEQTPAQAQ